METMIDTGDARESLGTSPISLRGTSEGFEILIESAADASRIAGDIQTKLDEAPAFFKGGNVILHFDDTPPTGYLSVIENVTQRYDLRIIGVHGPKKTAEVEKSSLPKNASKSAGAEALLDQLGLVEPVIAAGSEPVVEKVQVDRRAGQEQAKPLKADNELLAPKMIVGPVRSGVILEVSGHLIVLGDVNPGAEIRAVGSIVVLGRMRGIGHAGCMGGSAFILALQMEPQQLRIASLVARAGDTDESPEKAEIAYAKDGAIIVDYYKGKVPSGIATAKI